MALIRFSSLDSINRPISLPVIEEIFDSIPRVLLTEKEEAEIDKFISLCENLVAGNVNITPGTCVAQFIMANSDSAGKYSGGYNVAEGDTWFDKQEK